MTRALRQFERVNLPDGAPVYAEEDGEHLGRVRVLGRGGMMVETSREFVEGSPHRLAIVDDSEKLRFSVVGVALYHRNGGVGFEFRSLEIDAAVEIGVILGKYYAESHGE